MKKLLAALFFLLRTSGGRDVYTKVNLPVGNISYIPFYIKTGKWCAYMTRC